MSSNLMDVINSLSDEDRARIEEQNRKIAELTKQYVDALNAREKPITLIPDDELLRQAMLDYASISCKAHQSSEYITELFRRVGNVINDVDDYLSRQRSASILGSVKSERKAETSRKNGRHGGRPKKQTDE